MKHYGERIALKPYLERITAYCGSLSKDEVIEIVRSLAQEVSVSGRIDFLDKIESCLSKSDLPAESERHLLDAIEALKEEIVERVDSIENGTYWEESDGWDGEYYDEDPDNASEEQIEELANFFDVVENLFIDEQLEKAREGYRALFQLLDETDLDPALVYDMNVDIKEARARYCRCVYEIADKDKMVNELLAAMEVDGSMYYQPDILSGDYPLLQDVIDARAGEMDDLDGFFPVWRNALSSKNLNDRKAVLLLEAIERLEGLNGVAKLAKTWKNEQPWGHQYWLHQLKAKKEWKQILDVGKQALPIIHKTEFRERIAEHIIEAAYALKDKGHILLGKREMLFTRPSESNMLDLLNEAINQKCRDEELEKMLEFLKDQKDAHYGKESLLVKGLLATGKLEEAFARIKEAKSVGWSSGSAGIVFGSILFVLTDYSEQTTTLNDLMKGYSERATSYSWRVTSDIEDEPSTNFFEEIKKGLSQTAFSKSDRTKYLAWAIMIGQSRIAHIVSNQHRNAYDRAAKVLGALAETHIAMGEDRKATNLLHKYCMVEFKRHSAFRREVKSVVSRSDLLRKLGFSV